MGLLIQDALRRPELFQWHGRIAPTILDRWLVAHKLRVPDDLYAFWRETGGGELFETETILAPFGEPSLGDDIDGANRYHRDHGLPEDLLLFHIGVCYSAISLSDSAYVSSDSPSFSIRRRHASLDGWYFGEIRKEYGDRYGL